MLVQFHRMDDWSSGYTQSELDDAQERYGVRFPPDLVAMYLERQPANAYAWNTEDGRIRTMLRWPLDAMLFDVQHGSWWSDWGAQPSSEQERDEVVIRAFKAAPKLIPLYGHRFIPELPDDAGNPIFSMHGFDTIYYGSDLGNYIAREFGDPRLTPLGDIVRHIPFWSDLAENPEKWI